MNNLNVRKLENLLKFDVQTDLKTSITCIETKVKFKQIIEYVII